MHALKQRLAFGPLMLYALAIAIALLALSGCSQLGLTAPKTFDEKTYAAAETVKQVQVSAATLVRAGKISPADGENVLKATDAAVEGIRVARSYQVSAPATANSKLEAVLAALTLAQAYLATQGAK